VIVRAGAYAVAGGVLGALVGGLIGVAVGICMNDTAGAFEDGMRLIAPAGALLGIIGSGD
jgi:hypothetical protein